jgi:hypothetical protein
VRVWNETTKATPALSGAESYKDFTINVTAGPTSVALTNYNSSAAVWVDAGTDDIPATGDIGAWGNLLKVTLSDATGALAALAIGESVIVDPTLSATVCAVNGTMRTDAITAGGAYALTPADFTNGVAFVNICDETAETSVIVVNYGASVTTNTSTTFRAVQNGSATADYTIAPTALSTGWYRASANTYDVPLTASVGFTVTDNDATDDDDFTATEYAAARVKDVSGKVTGLTNGFYDRAVLNGGTFTVAATFTTTGQTFRVSDDADDTVSDPDHVFTSAARDITTGGANTVTPNGSFVAAKGGSLSFTALVKDQFGVAYANGRVTLSIAGRNGTQATQSGTTSSTGYVTFTVTDTAASTVTATQDTITVTAFDENTSLAASAITVTWSTLSIGTVTLAYPGEDDVIAGTVTTDINAAAGGAGGTYATVTATVKDANSVLMVGVPVTCSVAGLTGAEVHSTYATQYTGSLGTAACRVSSYAAGKATVTMTAGSVSTTADIYFEQADATEARTISAAAAGGLVTATVKDRYGNPIEGVTVNATRTGTGYFGNGASSASGSTDANGVIEFYFTGTGTVKVAFSNALYGQSADAAGYVGGDATTGTAVTAAAAGTSTVVQKGIGASLAPAGVNSATVAVTATDAAASAAEAAADAAAEAIDAANAATDAANLAAEAADAATVAAEEARDAADAATAAVEELSTQVATLMAALRAQITTLANTVAKIAKKVRA